MSEQVFEPNPPLQLLAGYVPEHILNLCRRCFDQGLDFQLYPNQHQMQKMKLGTPISVGFLISKNEIRINGMRCRVLFRHHADYLGKKRLSRMWSFKVYGGKYYRYEYYILCTGEGRQFIINHNSIQNLLGCRTNAHIYIPISHFVNRGHGRIGPSKSSWLNCEGLHRKYFCA